ncbi:MAG: heat-shock protein Hsp20 [Bacteroidetes bacterium RIFOXYA12_FULL_35_11]|nr:MAG: heat-shock protein Hsp20 [Bacteroidetes bacterium GWF2_35_48]OFY76770.1 MAG: heat-shock protein Hsp20 [Bacteroidetes bacterium RIFOXYA12_FULL_35_11]OFY92380.1 MAG: heat-shock protein Hsp20 [Bacteroidetes bacterium RIFOXYB2_FULL_35_7]OFY92756.1 MAG: heat-shock protein Hsp20 [Bacteroidetes bacterium RIFOXYC12_FULL_35_7]HBX50015.1 heat-shock protein Hsp20 [Bacteroidales bacterium]
MLPIMKTRNVLPTLVDEFFGKDVFPTLWDLTGSTTVPAVNILETKDEFKIEVAAPGLEKADFKIDLHNQVLTISSEKELKNEQTEERYMRREFSYTSFKRSFTLPQSANSDKVQANHKDGILTVVIPKREEAKEKPARRIDIE